MTQRSRGFINYIAGILFLLLGMYYLIMVSINLSSVDDVEVIHSTLGFLLTYFGIALIKNKLNWWGD